MKTAVIYRSHYGYTHKYAQWISQALNAPLFEASQFSPAHAAEFDQIIFGGALYAGHISGIRLITKNPLAFTGKKLIIFVVGLSPVSENLPAAIALNNIPKEASCFYLQGGFDVSKLAFHHKFMMYALRFALKLKKSKESAFIEEIFKAPHNFCSQEALAPLLKNAQNQ